MDIAFSYIDSSDCSIYRPIITELANKGHNVFCVEGGDPLWIDRTRIEKLLKDDQYLLCKIDDKQFDLVISRGKRNTVLCKAKAYVFLASVQSTGWEGFDFTLVSGDRIKSLAVRSCRKVYTVGLPFLDRILSTPETCRFEICYAPSWGPSSSFSWAANAIVKLGGTFPGSCLFRPHESRRRLGADSLNYFPPSSWKIPFGNESLAALSRQSGLAFIDDGPECWESAIVNDFTIACRAKEDQVLSEELRKYVPTVQHQEDINKIKEFTPSCKAIPLKYCEYRSGATQRCVRVLETIYRKIKAKEKTSMSKHGFQKSTKMVRSTERKSKKSRPKNKKSQKSSY